MRRLLPAPWLSLALFAGWMLLTRSFSPGQALLGAAAAVAIPALLASLRPRPAPLKRPGVLLRLVLRVGRDVVRSGLRVALGVLRARHQPPRGAFVTVPLDLRDEHALAALAMITSVIPGSIWSELAADRSRLLIHVFDLDDEAAFIAHYKADYEQPLKEIFE
ncbi:MAG: Na+/H+ antiporter subunit E [Roseateles sp.]|uniref:Na+/H+ antiporter subunit E n=1 Tax=Roseateles sp. TaxID=1971397 RepID=UPI0039EA1583